MIEIKKKEVQQIETPPKSDFKPYGCQKPRFIGEDKYNYESETDTQE